MIPTLAWNTGVLANGTPAPETESSGFLYEQVAFAANGLDAPRMDGVIANFGANPGNANINGTVLAIVLNAAQSSEDFFPAENAAGVAGQQPEQIKFGTGQIDAFIIQPGFAHGAVNNQIVELETHRFFATRFVTRTLARLGNPAQHGTYTCQQYPGFDRLADVVVRAHFQTENLVQIVGAGGQHDDRTGIEGTHPTANGQPVFTRQHQIQHHQIRLLVTDPLYRGAAMGFQGDSQPVAFKVFAG